MSIPEYPTLPSQAASRGAPRSRLGRLVMGGLWLVTAVVSLAALILIPGGLILFVLLIGQGEWVAALAALAAIVGAVLVIRLVGRRLMRPNSGKAGEASWDEHF